MKRLFLITLLATVASAAPAQAGTISIAKGSEGVSRENGFWVVYGSAGALGNDVTAKWDAAAQTFTITDKTEPIVPMPVDSWGPNLWPLSMCTYTVHTATCKAFANHDGAHFILRLGSGPDKLRIDLGSTSSVDFSGGAGDDLLEITGSGGSVVRPGDGNDTVKGGSGGDRVWASPGADRVSGGGGKDIVLYGPQWDEEGNPTDQAPVTGVRITPDGIADDGQPGEGDNVLADVEAFEGTPFDDVILGGPAAEDISGRDGADQLSGGPGADTVDGGGGADLIDTRDGFADRYACWSGTEIVRADPLDTPRYPGMTCGTLDVQP